MTRAIANQRALKDFMGNEVLPGPACSDSDEDIDRFIRERALTTHHPLGTCAMGTNGRDAVVDGQLRVFGAEKLRVVDASVIPTMIGGNINAGVMMIAEKAADSIRGRAAPARRHALVARAG